MTIAYVQSAKAQGVNVSSLTTGGITTTTGNGIAMGAAWDHNSSGTAWSSWADNGTSNTFTDSGNASVVDGNGDGGIRAAYCDSINGKSGHTFTVNYAVGGVNYLSALAVEEYTGQSASSYDKTCTCNTGFQASPFTSGNTATLSQANELVIAFCTLTSGGGGNRTLGAGNIGGSAANSRQTGSYVLGGGGTAGIVLEDLRVTSTTATNFSFTASGNSYGIGIGMTFKETAGGTTYAGSVSETGTASDTVAGALVLTAAVSESGSASDTVGGSLVLTAAISETGAAADTIAATLTLSGAVSETGSAADICTGTLALTGTISESGSAADTVGGTIVSGNISSVSETGSLTDTVGAQLVLIGGISETGTALDTVGCTYVSGTVVAPTENYFARHVQATGRTFRVEASGRNWRVTH